MINIGLGCSFTQINIFAENQNDKAYEGIDLWKLVWFHGNVNYVIILPIPVNI